MEFLKEFGWVLKEFYAATLFIPEDSIRYLNNFELRILEFLEAIKVNINFISTFELFENLLK